MCNERWRVSPAHNSDLFRLYRTIFDVSIHAWDEFYDASQLSFFKWCRKRQIHQMQKSPYDNNPTTATSWGNVCSFPITSKRAMTAISENFATSSMLLSVKNKVFKEICWLIITCVNMLKFYARQMHRRVFFCRVVSWCCLKYVVYVAIIAQFYKKQRWSCVVVPLLRLLDHRDDRSRDVYTRDNYTNIFIHNTGYNYDYIQVHIYYILDALI